MLERQLVDGLDLKNGFSLWKHERNNIALSFCIITYFIEVYNNTMSRFLVAAGVCISLMGLSEGSDAPFLHSYKSFRAKSSPKFRLRSRSPFVSTHKHTVSPPKDKVTPPKAKGEECGLFQHLTTANPASTIGVSVTHPSRYDTSDGDKIIANVPEFLSSAGGKMKYHVNCEHSLQSDTELCKTIDVCKCDPTTEPFEQRITGGLILNLGCSKKADGSHAITYKLKVNGEDYPLVFSPDKNPTEKKVEALDVSTPGGGGGGDGALHRRRRLLQGGGNES